TEVKLLSADGSWGLSPCESRTLPGEDREFFSLSFLILIYWNNLTPVQFIFERHAVNNFSKNLKKVLTNYL
uniref:hypothetical protein n=1 Tax=Cytobacillus firmus TaxID=1399 RepID=UPI001C2F089F